MFIVFSLNSYGVLSQQPQLSLQALLGPSWYVMEDEYNSKSSLDFNYSAGGYLLFNIPIKANTISLRSGYFYESKNYIIDYDNSISWQKKRVERSFTYGNLPILLEIRFNVKDKFYPFLSSGVIFGWVLSSEQIIEKVDGTLSYGFASRSYVEEKQTDFYASSGLNFRLNRLFLFRLELFMSQQIIEGGSGNADRFGKFSYGLKAGIQFDIFLPDKWLD
jgi:hypothetical protein